MPDFFRSKLHPHLSMNKWGVVFAPKGHEHAVDHFAGWDEVPLRNGLLDLKYEVEDEARQAGYTSEYVRTQDGVEKLFKKPPRVSHQTQSTG